MKIQIESQSIAAGKKNGDYILHQVLPNEATLILLADGMGGLSSPEIASQLVCKAISEYLVKGDAIDCTELIRMSIEYADNCLAEFCKEKRCKMGTALTLMYLSDDNLFYVSFGDVRLYHKNKQGEVALLTTDHVIVQGENVYLTNCISGRGFRKPIQVQLLSLNTGDLFLLCSDGYYKVHDIPSSFLRKDLLSSPLGDDDCSVVRIKVI
ncbi:PP2C family protein-serine/threonine phosphatase [Porphyromonas gulae]|uniref:Serine/threonine protein phosphatase n=1 Tax=Porphyromonas gulae TaxID=111105 RepID=A0A0A2F816_9PORP|nr:protein phosphatase 2C domain-containing protein [Porphyromonas gulae]KGN87166.1 serine/threonine protein phosphatase [Porphyromonas gulae]